MGKISSRELGLAVLVAAGLAVSSCAAQAQSPQVEATRSDAASASAFPSATATAAGPTPAALDAMMLEGIPGAEQSDSDKQMLLGQAYINAMVQSQYSLSGKWSEDGNSHVNTARLWANYFSPELQQRLTEAGNTGDASAFGAWAVFALGSPDSSDAIKASPSCAAATSGLCAFTLPIDDSTIGARQIAGGTQSGSMDLTVPNRVAFNYDVVVPVSLKEHNNAEGVLKGVLQVDLSFVPNPVPGPGKPDFLINSVNNVFEGASADLLSNSPELLPMQ